MLVPSSWSTPALQWGVLPAHAQTSGGNTGGDNSGGNSGANTGDTNGGSNGANNGGNTGTNNGGNNAGDMDSGLVDAGAPDAGPPSACPPADAVPKPLVVDAYEDDAGTMPSQPHWLISFGPDAGSACSVVQSASASYQVRLDAFLSLSYPQGQGQPTPVWTANAGSGFTVTNVNPMGINGALSTQAKNLPFDTDVVIDGDLYEGQVKGNSARVTIRVTAATGSALAKLTLVKVQIPGPT